MPYLIHVLLSSTPIFVASTCHANSTRTNPPIGTANSLQNYSTIVNSPLWITRQKDIGLESPRAEGLAVHPALGIALIITYNMLNGRPRGLFTVIFRIAVLGPAFTPGKKGVQTSHSRSAPFTGLLFRTVREAKALHAEKARERA
jgi:hypothetical protein